MVVTLIKRWELAALERYYEGYFAASGQGISRDRMGWAGGKTGNITILARFRVCSVVTPESI